MIIVNRNVKKKNTNNSEMVLEIPKDITYKFPNNDRIDPGKYVSEIMYTMKSKTRNNQDAFDVCYDIVEYYDYVKFLKGYKPKKECKKYEIRQRYPLESESARAFIEAVYAAGYDNKFKLKDIVGMKEVVTIEYYGNSTMGSIQYRVPYDCYFTESDEESYEDDDYYEE